LKIKGLCEINDHTATESDTEVIYPPHKKIRASRHFENNNSIGNSNKNHSQAAAAAAATSVSPQKSSLSASNHGKLSVVDENSRTKQHHHHHKSLVKDPKNSSNSPNSSNSSKNMASLEMGMVMAIFEDFTFVLLKLTFPSSPSHTEWQRCNGCTINVYGFCS
jgi:hypothetical protein